MPFTCEACCAPSRTGVRCDRCALEEIQSLLRSSAWVAVAKTRTGDLPGETMVDTMRRELRSLEAIL